ncbi:MAG: coenzyme F420-0:L-glutamate ligase [Methanobacterium sp.]|nr:coenzyme F420-0:L-glutamate ligase [Methanobacterium sp.]
MILKIMGITGIPLIKKGDNLADLIIESLKDMGLEIQEDDILVIAETAVAKAEGYTINLQEIEPGLKAREIARQTSKEPELVEAIIQESNELIKIGPDFIISETKHGFVCANAGIDESNVEKGLATPIPKNPDISASLIRAKIQNKTGNDLVVIISDTQGRAFREGAVGVAIGISGMDPLWDRSGEKDLYNRELKTTTIAVADELSAAASVVMGQADEGIPVVLIRGFNYPEMLKNDSSNVKPLIRPKKYDVFRQ